MKCGLNIWRMLVLSHIFCVFAFGSATADTTNLDNFAVSDEWLAVVHYQKKIAGYKSTIDTSDFFLSPCGKTNPRCELEATIALFASNDDKTKCNFPSRYKLLKKHGIVDYPFPKCDELEQFYADLQPSGITLLFTDAYMNNPSSLFGHTLIRIDTARKGTQLLAHGANYGAFTGEENGALFAIRGLTGGYFGGFTVKPYYDIINTYNNIENRDIWEFSLNLSDEEMDMFVAHLWEIGHAQSRYFFFTRNCSYMLMEMFDAVRPSLKLAQDFPLQAIPLDTLKAVVAKPDFVKSIKYRPSRQNKIRHRIEHMNDEQKEYFYNTVENKDYVFADIHENIRAAVLETTYQYIQYQYVAKKLELKDYRAQSFRALLGINSAKNKDNLPELTEGKNPTQSHDSMRTEVLFGSRNGDAFQEISYRPAYHSVTDNDYGFLKGAEINFLDFSARHYDRTDKYVLQKINLLGIKSYSPIDALFAPISFQIGADIKREENPVSRKEGYAFNFVGGVGATFAATKNVWFYAMNRAHLAYGGFLPHNQYAGIEFAVGSLIDIAKLKILAEAQKSFATSHYGAKTIYSIESAYPLSRNLAVSAKYSYEHNYGADFEEFSVGFRIYF